MCLKRGKMNILPKQTQQIKLQAKNTDNSGYKKVLSITNLSEILNWGGAD